MFPHTMDEVLLCRPLLRRMGFDLPAHLNSIRDKFHNVDFASFFNSQDSTSDVSDYPGNSSALSSLLMMNNGQSH